MDFVEKELGFRVERSLDFLEAMAVEAESKERRRRGKGRGKVERGGEAKDQEDWRKSRAVVPSYKIVDAVDSKLVFYRGCQ